jgi:hypothetical protein
VIVVGPELKPEEIAQGIMKSVQEMKRQVCIITSSDFTHYGYNYGYVPFRQDVKKNLYSMDKKAIEFIEKRDSKGFLNYTVKTGATICGKYPIATMIGLSKLFKTKDVKLLNYYTSGDITGFENAVGYASIMFK